MNKNTHRVLKCITKHKRIYRSDLMRITRILKNDMDEIVEHLESVGAIESFRDVKVKRNPMCYRIIDGIVVHNIIETGCAHCGVVLTDQNISKIVNKKGYAFCNVCANRSDGTFGMGKQSSTCFGTYFAETALSKVFKNVERAPHGNPSYDFICNHGKKIDVKASCVGTGRQWEFAIDKNTEADYFLLAAFDNRVDLNLVHLWLIPGNVINHRQRVGIGMNTAKWDEYNLPIDKATRCCNNVQQEMDGCVWNDIKRLPSAKVYVQKERDIWFIPKIMI